MLTICSQKSACGARISTISVCKKTGHVGAWPDGCACQPQAACVKGETYESKTPADVWGVAVARLIAGSRFVAGCTAGGLYIVCAMVDALREVAQALA